MFSRRAKILAAAIMLTAGAGAQEIVRPVSSVWMLEVGSSHVANTYLSPEKFAGQRYGLTYSRLQAMKGRLANCIQGWNAGAAFSTGNNRAGNSRMAGATLGGSWRMIRRWHPAEGFQAGIGGYAGADFGVLYLGSNTNNPAQALAAISIGPEAFAQWSGKLSKLPLAVRWQVSSPLAGAFFCQDYGELYYEIQLGNHSNLAHFAWPGSRREIKSLLSVDLNFGRSTLRLGYKLDALSERANNITTRMISHCAVVGVVCDLVTINPRTKNEKLLPALY